MSSGDSLIDRDENLILIGIHNQDPHNLYIQFSLGERYFLYERNVPLKEEHIHEQLFGMKEGYQDSLNYDDEQYLIHKLRFIPKTRREFSAYGFKSS